MKHWGEQPPPEWVAEIAGERPRPLVIEAEPGVSPVEGDIVVKPVHALPGRTATFRVETWRTHDLLDGPFDDVHDALEAAFQLGATSHLPVWLDYSDWPQAHDLDPVPLYQSC